MVSEIGAAGLRDVGRTLSALKKRYPGQLDLGRASCVVKGMLRWTPPPEKLPRNSGG